MTTRIKAERQQSIALNDSMSQLLNLLIDNVKQQPPGKFFSVARPHGMDEQPDTLVDEIVLVEKETFYALYQQAALLEECLCDNDRFFQIVDDLRAKGEIPTPGETTIQ